MRAPTLLLVAALAAALPPAAAQVAPADSARMARDLGRVVVTATRTAAALEDVPIPTTVVTAERAQADGVRSLDALLQTVPGLDLTSDFGTGLQVQGLDPDYTLVLIDGEPVIGRTAGVLDLSRLSLAGVDRVEIVRGPSSSLYGSDALAGVVHLVTATPREPRARIETRGGSQGLAGLAAEAEGGALLAGRAVGARLSLDAARTSGYDLDPERVGRTGPDTDDATADLRLAAELGPRTRLRVGARASASDRALEYAFEDATGGVSPIDQRSRRRTWSLAPELRHLWGGRFAARASAYTAGFEAETDVFEPLDGGETAQTYADRFAQTTTKAGVQGDALWSAHHRTVLGAGAQRDALDGERYGGARPTATQLHVFAQHEWEPSRRWALNASARLDRHSDAGTRLSPKAAVLARVSDRLRLRASVGSGFKAPDFRQLFLDFANGVGGYTLFGSARLAEGVARLEAEGRLDAIAGDPAALGTIRPETSVAVNAEVELAPSDRLRLTLGGFRNAVRDLIDVQPVGTLADGSPIYTYVNLARIRTEGLAFDVEARPAWPAAGGLTLAAGVQALRSRDLDKLDALRAGTVFERGADGRDRRLGPGDYANLFGRSTLSGTARVAYRTASASPWIASVRARVRSRYGLRDLDGNGLANRDDEFVPATALVDATLTRELALPAGRLRLQLAVDNAFGTTRPALVPTLADRRITAVVGLSF